MCCSTVGLVEIGCKQVREINLCAHGYKLSLSLHYCKCTRELLPACELPAKSLQEAKAFAPHLPGPCGSFGCVEEILTPFCFSRSECGSKGRGKVRQEIWLPLRCFDNLLHKKQKPSGFSHCNVEHGLLETYSYSSVTRSEMLYLPQGTCERRAAPSALLEAMPAVQIIFFQNFMI